nr:hypothetical protein BaRGS_002503 [Batillaria attramentaria]
MRLRGKDLVLQQHGGHAVDFKGEAFTFKATTAGIIATLSHCIDLMSQREEAWKKRLEREIDRRKKYEEAYKLTAHEKKLHVVGGPDYEEGPHCMITEDEFYDAVDATLDKLEKEEEKVLINEITTSHLRRLLSANKAEEQEWQCIVDQGDLKVFKRELEENGIVIDPMKAVCTVKRDACFWSHIRHIPAENDEGSDNWIVVNYSTDHPSCPSGKYVRITMNVAMICQTIIEPPSNGGDITRDNITCKITYTADENFNVVIFSESTNSRGTKPGMLID